MRLILPLVALALTLPAAAPAPGPFSITETGQSFATLDEAVSLIRDDQQVTILIQPGVYRQCTVQTTGIIRYQALQPGSVIFDGTACEGKAAFVLRGRGSTVDGIVFRNIRVPDGNGAGIRTETGDLTVVNAMFLDSQEGILGGHPSGQRITIDRSTFAGLGQCNETEDCAHGIYLSNRGSVTITRSRFERGRGGHYVKLRVPTLTISDSSFDDSRGSATNYMIDLPEGGSGRIDGNTFVQGRNKENWTGFIVVAAEARTYRSAGLRIENNVATLAPGVDKSPAFVVNASGERLILAGNRTGPGIREYQAR